jgi:hypothetical protein
MKNLDRSKNQVSTTQAHSYNMAQKLQELESYKQQADQLWQQYLDAEDEKEKYKKEAEQVSAIVQTRQKENQNLLQRLLNAIKSRNSMRGKLGNMTAQRNRALRQVEKLTAQNREVMLQLKTTTDKLGEAYQQVGALQAEYDQDMLELAGAYQEMTWEQRATLPPKLRQLLDQLEREYTGGGQ